MSGLLIDPCIGSTSKNACHYLAAGLIRHPVITVAVQDQHLDLALCFISQHFQVLGEVLMRDDLHTSFHCECICLTDDIFIFLQGGWLQRNSRPSLLCAKDAWRRCLDKCRAICAKAEEDRVPTFAAGRLGGVVGGWSGKGREVPIQMTLY